MLCWCYLKGNCTAVHEIKGLDASMYWRLQWHFCLQPVVLVPPAGSKHEGEDAHVQLFYFEATALAYYNCWLFIRQKQEWMDQLVDTENRKRLGRAGTHRHAAMAQNAMYSILYLYIFISYIQNNSETQTNARHLILHSYRTKTDQPFSIKKKIFSCFLCKSATQLK